MLKIALVIIAAILIALIPIYYDGVADFMKMDSCLDGGGRWLQKQQECQITRERRADLPAWMGKYVVLVEANSHTEDQ